jgi:hypothetical protein
MPCYFFAVDDVTLRYKDHFGHDLLGPEQARLMALDALPDMARETIPDGDYRCFKVSAVDEHGDVIYRASLTLKGEWVKKSVLI